MQQEGINFTSVVTKENKVISFTEVNVIFQTSYIAKSNLINPNKQIESISVYVRMQSSENSIYVRNSAIRKLTLHLTNTFLSQSAIPVEISLNYE